MSAAFDIAMKMMRKVARKVAWDDKWITVKPNGPDNTGRPVLIGEGGEIRAGMGGKFNGRSIDDVPRGKNPHPVPEEKWQARQERKANAGGGAPGGQQTGGQSEAQQTARKSVETQIINGVEYVKNNKDAPEEVRAYYGGRGPLATARRKGLPRNVMGEAMYPAKLPDSVKQTQSSGQAKSGKALQEERFRRDERVEAARAEYEAAKKADNNVKRNDLGQPVPPKKPDWVPEGYWNGKVYPGNRIFVDGREIKANAEKIEALEKWKVDYAAYKRAREADTATAPKEYLNVRYDDRNIAKAAGAKWDPTAKKWYWDKRSGEMPEGLQRFQEKRDATGTLKNEALFPPGYYREGDLHKMNGQWVILEKFKGRQEIDDDDPSVYGSHLLGHEGSRGVRMQYRAATENEVREKKEKGARLAYGDLVDRIPGLTEAYGETGRDLSTMLEQYPQAAAYMKADEKSRSYHPELAAIGRRAKEKIAKTGDWQGALQDMENEDKEFVAKHQWDAALGVDSSIADEDNPNNYDEMSALLVRPALDRALVPLAFDRASVRTMDENGFMHVAASHITKATVNPYQGREIPGWKEAGLDPDHIYHGLRDPEELQKSIPTWSGLPLHIEHHIDSADEPQKLTRVGTVGTEVVWNDPYIDAPLTVWDKTAIDSIKDGSFRELSCAYRYDPDFTAGEYEGQPYDFVMRNIRGNHVALVEEGRAGRDVLVADAALKAGQNDNNSNMEKLVMAISKWFRGAKDSNPEVEQTEVDLAQAIIDLHKVDPLTGEVKDVAEDDDRVAELKVLVESLKDKLPPEDLKKLTDVISALAVAQAADNSAEHDAPAGDEADAMKKAGCDAENPDEVKAFAEGVKYGEELEKNPAERAKLDREHESEGMKKAMDACGLDAEDPAETKAFAEGVKYGEEKERTEREKLDKEHESEGMKAAEDEDKNAMIEKIIAAVPGLSEEQIAKMRDTLADLAYSPATGDEDIDEKVEAATDSALKRRRFLGATDAARIKAQATADAMARMRSLHEAVRRVRPLVGEMDAMSFDSANNVYGYTLEQMGIDPRKYDKRAWRGMVDVMLQQQTAARVANATFAKDSAKIPSSGPFKHLNNITIG